MSTSQEKALIARGFTMNLRDGLTPIAIFTGTVIVTVAVTTLLRTLFASAGYGAQRTVVLIFTGVGLLAAIILYIIAMRRAWKTAKDCEEQGRLQDAQSIRWITALGSLLFIVPIILGFVLPQHPAVLG
jgi:membrane protease YdiL (CAAX protease family)